MGDFSGNLSNSGEVLSLVDNQGRTVEQIRYYDSGSWPLYADGGGCSLERRDPHAEGNAGSNWAASDEPQRSVWQTYEIRFRAHWMAGTPLLHTRLFFNRLAHTTVVTVPPLTGTPGATNSNAVENLGPTYTQLSHTPAVPTPNEWVRVQVQTTDPDGVTRMVLRYRLDNGSCQQRSMTSTDGMLDTAKIPPFVGGSIIQFYVAGFDSTGALSFHPPLAKNSYCQYEVINPG